MLGKSALSNFKPISACKSKSRTGSSLSP